MAPVEPSSPNLPGNLQYPERLADFTADPLYRRADPQYRQPQKANLPPVTYQQYTVDSRRALSSEDPQQILYQKGLETRGESQTIDRYTPVAHYSSPQDVRDGKEVACLDIANATATRLNEIAGGESSFTVGIFGFSTPHAIPLSRTSDGKIVGADTAIGGKRGILGVNFGPNGASSLREVRDRLGVNVLQVYRSGGNDGLPQLWVSSFSDQQAGLLAFLLRPDISDFWFGKWSPLLPSVQDTLLFHQPLNKRYTFIADSNLEGLRIYIGGPLGRGVRAELAGTYRFGSPAFDLAGSIQKDFRWSTSGTRNSLSLGWKSIASQDPTQDSYPNTYLRAPKTEVSSALEVSARTQFEKGSFLNVLLNLGLAATLNGLSIPNVFKDRRLDTLGPIAGIQLQYIKPVEFKSATLLWLSGFQAAASFPLALTENTEKANAYGIGQKEPMPLDIAGIRRRVLATTGLELRAPLAAGVLFSSAFHFLWGAPIETDVYSSLGVRGELALQQQSGSVLWKTALQAAVSTTLQYKVPAQAKLGLWDADQAALSGAIYLRVPAARLSLFASGGTLSDYTPYFSAGGALGPWKGLAIYGNGRGDCSDNRFELVKDKDTTQCSYKAELGVQGRF